MGNNLQNTRLVESNPSKLLTVPEAFPFIHMFKSENGIESGFIDQTFFSGVIHQINPEFGKLVVAHYDPLIHDLQKVSGYIVLRGGAIRDLLLKSKIPNDFDLIGTNLDHQDSKRITSVHGEIVSNDEPRQQLKFNLHGIMGDIRSLPPGSDVTPAFMVSQADFTLNTISYDYNTGELRSEHSGLTALANKTLTMVSDDKFSKRLWTIARGIRIAIDLGGSIDDQTLKKMAESKKTFEDSESFDRQITYERNRCTNRVEFEKAWLAL